MEDISWFKFENRDYDFPCYRHNPKVSKFGWIVLFFAIFVGYLLQLIPNVILGGFLFFMVPLVALLYYLNWDVKAIFRKPAAKEVGLAVLLFVGYIIYCIVIGTVLDAFSLSGSEIVSKSYVTIELLASLIFSLMGEELLKLIPFLFFMRLVYKYSNNRKLSVIVALLIVIACFGLLHVADMKSIVSVLLMQGLGSMFEFYGYIKTKNVLIPYITHLCTDAFIFIIILLGV